MNLNRKKRILIWVIPIVLLLLYLGLLSFAPEPSSRHAGGLVVLNVSGDGYSLGNVVWLASPEGCDPEDVVLYDWHKIHPHGYGPAFALCRYDSLATRDRQHVVARISLKAGHNYLKARQFKNRVY